MEKKFFTDEEMRKQWDDLEAAWVILDAWAMEKSGKPLNRTSMRPDKYKKTPDSDPLRPDRWQGLSKASRACLAIHALEGLEPSEESLQALRDIDAGIKTTEQAILELAERIKPYRPEDHLTGEEQEQFFDRLGELMDRPSPVKDATEADIKRQWEGFTLDADDNLITVEQDKAWSQEVGRRIVEASKRMETDPEYRKYIQSIAPR